MRSTGAASWLTTALLLVAVSLGSHVVAQQEPSDNKQDAEWYVPQQLPEDAGQEERLAHMLVMTAALQATSAASVEPGASPEDALGSLAHDLIGSSWAQQLVSTALPEALGPDFARYTALGAGGSGHLHIDLHSLLQLSPDALRQKMADIDSKMATAAGATAPSNGSSASSQSNGTTATRGRHRRRRRLQQADGGDGGEGPPPLWDGAISISRDPGGTGLADAWWDMVANSRKAQKKTQAQEAVNELLTSWGVDWADLQQRVHAKLGSALTAAVNRLPRIKAANRLQQVFKITTEVTCPKVLVDRLAGVTGGPAAGCTPYTFNPGGTALPETIILPSFSLSQTTGNCVILPELIGNTEYPGQWSLVNSRVACLGPAAEYLIVPAFYRSAATSGETFACPTCRNEFSVGPAVTITLLGDSRGTVKYGSKAEFLAALKTDAKLWAWGGAAGGSGALDSALRALRAKLTAVADATTSRTGNHAWAWLAALAHWLDGVLTVQP